MKRQFQWRKENAKAPMVVDAAVAEIRRRALDGEDFDVLVSEPKRTLPENALLHTIISELAKKVEWAGKKRDVETWKRLLVAAWCRSNGKPIEILPALDGNGVELIPVRTSGLGKRACAELIEFIYAWGADKGIQWESPDDPW